MSEQREQAGDDDAAQDVLEPRPAASRRDDKPKTLKQRLGKLRPWLRGMHRDIGYVAVGLTLVYAISGLAVNHIADWDPNTVPFEQRVKLQAPMPEDEDAAVKQVLTQLGAADQPVRDVFYYDGELDLLLDAREIHANNKTGEILDRGKRNRVLLRVANWLHLNRGKRAWTFVADTYAVALLFLAISGMFMIPGRKGIRGRGAILVIAGISIPVAYVVLSGGP